MLDSVPWIDSPQGKTSLENAEVLQHFRDAGLDKALTAIEQAANHKLFGGYPTALLEETMKQVRDVSSLGDAQAFHRDQLNPYRGLSVQKTDWADPVDIVDTDYTVLKMPLPKDVRRSFIVPPHRVVQQTSLFGSGSSKGVNKAMEEMRTVKTSQTDIVTQQHLDHLEKLLRNKRVQKFRKLIRKAAAKGKYASLATAIGDVLKTMKPAYNSMKFGFISTHGRWPNSFIFTLTGEERASCPSNCHVLAECFGNSARSVRIQRNPLYIQAREMEMAWLSDIFEGFLVNIRAHELGDFTDPEDVTSFFDTLSKHSNLRSWITTHRHSGFHPEAYANVNSNLDLASFVTSIQTGFSLQTMAMRHKDLVKVQRSTFIPGIPNTLRMARQTPEDAFAALPNENEHGCFMHNPYFIPEDGTAAEAAVIASKMDDVSCASCGACWQEEQRQVIIPEHGGASNGIKNVGGGQFANNAAGIIRDVHRKIDYMSMRRIRKIRQAIASLPTQDTMDAEFKLLLKCREKFEKKPDLKPIPGEEKEFAAFKAEVFEKTTYAPKKATKNISTAGPAISPEERPTSGLGALFLLWSQQPSSEYDDEPPVSVSVASCAKNEGMTYPLDIDLLLTQIGDDDRISADDGCALSDSGLEEVLRSFGVNMNHPFAFQKYDL